MQVSFQHSTSETALFCLQDDVFSISVNLVVDQLHSSLTVLTNSLMALTTPSNISLLPQDLGSTNYILENIIRVSPTALLHTVSLLSNGGDSSRQL